MRHAPKILLTLVLAGLVAIAAPAAQTAGVAHRVMANGMEVFAVENRSVPLVTICVTFRGGASAQTPETAGLFHLYEHMMFAGNSKYPTKEAFTGALKGMGTASWNGSTGTEYINYYISIPSSRLDEGIGFWAAAMRSPTLDPATLDTEKQVVLNEIRGYHNDPAQVAVNALKSRVFAEYPWRKNIDGPEANIAGATVERLRELQSAFYVPRNMALMVGGDTSPAEVFALVEKYFGDWTGGPVPAFAEPPHGPFPAGVRVIAPDDSFYRGLAQVQYWWRGPDALRDTADTYVSDVLLFLMDSPVGPFKSAVMRRVPGLYDEEYIAFSYPTQRDGGAYYFSTYMNVQKPATEGAVLDRVESMRKAVLGEFARIADDPAAYFGAGELEKAKTKLIDGNLYGMENTDSFVTDTLTFWWSVATAEYFFGYEDACRRVTWDDISALVRRYITGAGGGAGGAASPGAAAASPAASGAPPSGVPESATLVRIRTSTYGTDLKMAAKLDELAYTRASPDNAFWWQK